MKVTCLILANAKDKSVEITKGWAHSLFPKVDDVVISYDLPEALSVITKQTIDIVIIDIDLSDEKVINILRSVRAVTNAVIIVLSDDDEFLGVEALKAGADEFIPKGMLVKDALRSSIVFSITKQHINETVEKMQSKIEKMNEIAKSKDGN